MVFQLYVKHTFYSVFTKNNIKKFFLIFILQILIQLFFLLDIFEEEEEISDSAILAFSTNTNTPFRLFLNLPRLSVLNKNSEFSNLGIKYYNDIKIIQNLTNVRLDLANQTQVDLAFIEDFNKGNNK